LVHLRTREPTYLGGKHKGKRKLIPWIPGRPIARKKRKWKKKKLGRDFRETNSTGPDRSLQEKRGKREFNSKVIRGGVRIGVCPATRDIHQKSEGQGTEKSCPNSEKLGGMRLPSSKKGGGKGPGLFRTVLKNGQLEIGQVATQGGATGKTDSRHW